MNKVFIFFSIIVSLYFTFYSNLIDVKKYPSPQLTYFSFLKNFNNDFPNIKEVGFFSTHENQTKTLMKIQSYIMPSIIYPSQDFEYIFCNVPNNGCDFLVNTNQVSLIKKYSEDITLVKRK